MPIVRPDGGSGSGGSVVPATLSPNWLAQIRSDFGASTTGISPGANVLELGPVWLETAMTVSALVVHVATQSGNIDVVMYSSDGASAAPLTRLVHSGSVACPAGGWRAIAVAPTLAAPGFYWTGLVVDNGVASLDVTSSTMLHGAMLSNRYVQAAAFPAPAAFGGGAGPSDFPFLAIPIG